MASITANGSKGHHKFTLTLVENSTSLDNNTSETTYTFQIAPKVKGYNWSNWGSQISYTITINNTTYTGTIPSYNGSSTVTLKTGTQTIEHDNDGTKIVNYSFSVSDTTGQSYTCGSASASGTLTLTTIPRASSIVVNDANIGSSTNITINRASANFTHTIYYKIHSASSWTTIVTKTSNQVYGWTVPTSLYNQIPNSKTIQLDFYATTYNGDTNIGNSAVVTATFTATGGPIINSVSLASTDSTTINLVGSSKMIRYISTVQATVNASAQNSATISSIKVNDITATNNVVTFTNCSTNNFRVVITDSRGYEIIVGYTMEWTDYIPLTLNASVKRNQPTDGKVNINFNGNYFNGSFNNTSNTLTIQYRSKETGGSFGSWTTISHTKSGNTYTGSTQLSNYDYTKQYELEIKATDLVKTITITGITISKGQPVFWYDDNEFNVNVDTNILSNVVSGNVKSKNLLDLQQCIFEHCILNNDKSVTSNISNFYFCSIKFTYLNDFILNNKGKNITFSISQAITNRKVSIVIYGTRTGGGSYQEFDSSTGVSYISGTIASDFTSVTQVELRFNRSPSTFTDTSTIRTDFMLEIDTTTPTNYSPYFEPLNEITDKLEGVSPMGDIIVNSIKGKNLFNINNLTLSTGSVSYSTGTITVNQFANSSVQKLKELCPNMIAGETYTLSFTTTSNNNYIYLVGSSSEWYSNTQRTITQNELDGLVYFYGNWESTATITITNIQIEKGSTKTSFTPYSISSSAINNLLGILNIHEYKAYNDISVFLTDYKTFRKNALHVGYVSIGGASAIFIGYYQGYDNGYAKVIVLTTWTNLICQLRNGTWTNTTIQTS